MANQRFTGKKQATIKGPKQANIPQTPTDVQPRKLMAKQNITNMQRK